MIQKEESYFKQLDGVRFVAVALVLWDHWMGEFNKIPFGALGVNLFFVLSGFLITRILLNSKDKYQPQTNGLGTYLKKFYIRRTIRIFPVYYLTIFVLFLLNVPPVRQTWGWCVLYASNVYIAIYQRWMGTIDHLWSLAVEEQFYIFFPLTVFFVPRRHFLKLTAAMIIGSVLLRLYCSLTGVWWGVPYVLMPTCLDAFGLGGLMAYLFTYQSELYVKIISQTKYLIISLLLLVLVLILSKTYTEPHNIMFNVWERLAASIFGFFFIGKAVLGYGGILKHILEHPICSYLGRISYGIYIYHNFVYNFYHTTTGHPTLRILNRVYQYFPILVGSQVFIVATSLVLTVALASVSWFLIEKPINNLKDRFTY